MGRGTIKEGRCPRCGYKVQLPCLKCQVEEGIPKKEIVFPKPIPPREFSRSDPVISKFAGQMGRGRKHHGGYVFENNV